MSQGRLETDFVDLNEIIKNSDFKKKYYNNLDKIISQFNQTSFRETVKLIDVNHLINLRKFLSETFISDLDIKISLSLKYRKGDKVKEALASDCYILTYCIVEGLITEEINNIYNLNLKPTQYIKEKEEIDIYISRIYNKLGLNSNIMSGETPNNNMNVIMDMLSSINNSLKSIKEENIKLNDKIENETSKINRKLEDNDLKFEKLQEEVRNNSINKSSSFSNKSIKNSMSKDNVKENIINTQTPVTKKEEKKTNNINHQITTMQDLRIMKIKRLINKEDQLS